MARDGMTELILTIEKNNQLTRNPEPLRQLLKYQAALPAIKIKLTLHIFYNDLNYHAIDFKNFRDIDLSPINTDETFKYSNLNDAVTSNLDAVLHRHVTICPCRVPERTVHLIIAEHIDAPLTHPVLQNWKIVLLTPVINPPVSGIGTTNIINYTPENALQIISHVQDIITTFRTAHIPNYIIN